MNTTEFSTKYDNGTGESAWGCSRSVNRIVDSEIVAAGGYDQLVSDFQSLDDNSKHTIAPYFQEDVTYKLLTRIDSNYTAFRNKFDNGDGIGCSENDDRYGRKEILAGGGLMQFKKELSALNPTVALVVNSRLDVEVSNEMEKGASSLFWKTYDNGKGIGSGKDDGRLNTSEIEHIGWDQFAEDIRFLTIEEGTRVLDSLGNEPPPATLARLSDARPDYFKPTNLRQLPGVPGGIYALARDGLAMIMAVTRKEMSSISRATLPAFDEPLAVNGSEQFYLDLQDALKNKPLYEDIDMRTFTELVQKHGNQPPRATIAKLNAALEQNPDRYRNTAYAVDLYGLMSSGDVSRTDSTRSVSIDDIQSNRPMINLLKDRGVRYEKSKKQEGSTEPAHYTFAIPVMEAKFRSLVCDRKTDLNATGCTFLQFSETFEKYRVDNRRNRVYQNWLDEDKLTAKLMMGAKLTVRPKQSVDFLSINHFNISLSTRWYLESTSDLVSSWNLLSEREVD